MPDAPRSPTLDDRLRQRERPPGRAAMYQSWRDLLFAHWRVEPERIQRTLPPGLFVDTFDGAAWVGVVPFFMRNIRPWWFPCVPWVSNFLELNLRTYVHDANGTPGVWFYALDCNQPLAVWMARTFFYLPYRHAGMRATPDERGAIRYQSHLLPRGTISRSLQTTYQLGPQRANATPGSLEFFLVERYLLFAADRRGKLFSGQVHHVPYPLCDAVFEKPSYVPSGNEFIDFDVGIDGRQPDHLLASPGVDVEIFGLQRV